MTYKLGHIPAHTGKRITTRPLVGSEIEAVKDVVQNIPRDRALLALALNTGLRASDLREIKFSQIVDGSLTIIERKTKKTKLIVLNDSTRDAIEAWRRVCPFEHVASGQRGQLAVGSIARLVKDWAGRAGVDQTSIASHTLRKTRARALIDRYNEPLYLVMRDLQHSSEAQTCAYLGITTADQRRLYSHQI